VGREGEEDKKEEWREGGSNGGWVENKGRVGEWGGEGEGGGLEGGRECIWGEAERGSGRDMGERKGRKEK